MSMLAVEARLAQVATHQCGAFTRAQAAGAGFSASQVQRRLDAGAWVRVYPRVYRHASSPSSRMCVLTAALLWAGRDCVLSHTTGAELWRVAADVPDRVELLVPRKRAPRAPGVVSHRVARLDGIDVTVARGGLLVTTPVRTLIDLAAVLPFAELAAVLDRALGDGLLTRRGLEGRLETLGTRGRPGTARLRTLLGTVGSGSRHASARMAG
jgi:hypothetical protein